MVKLVKDLFKRVVVYENIKEMMALSDCLFLSIANNRGHYNG